ncbi:hypothetical protein I5Q34_04075 [Streptomyces sp. AV19]|uniref:DUF6879 family protein n=1 Tax=Streptomyces sp. AV19 TaxID=2793068 RepID=UPI0018FE04B4|nr:DUF6879 family protein [Streptomyces sp. AV19]MBH1933472.1 hypothetical protein [Streptomyces sp. AV19]MDG4532121.1 hypothetical protein [Streptomyces sp. AV19]
MWQSNVPGFNELLESARQSAVHLEMRDSYGVGEEAADFERWKVTGVQNLDPESDHWKPWLDLISGTVARGVVVRRARIVSEPVTDYIRFEHASTFLTEQAGEESRWLTRSKASDIALPGNDFWLIDSKAVRFNLFSGDGAGLEGQYTGDPAVARLCATAFEAVWERAVPYGEFKV